MTEGATALGDLRPGASAVVRQLIGGQGLIGRLAAMGFTPGTEIEMIQNFGRGPLIVLVRSTRVALGRGEAAKVLVEASPAGGDSSTGSRQPARR